MKDKTESIMKQHKMTQRGDGVLVGLSGGADSTALLLCLQELVGALGITLYAAHINHMLRGAESQRDEDFCHELCQRLNIPFFLIRQDVAALAKKEKKSIELMAREVRYDAFETLCETHQFSKIATAHNQNDVIETFLFHIARGSSPDGLASIPPVRGKIIRPLIGCTRAEIEEYLKQRKQPYVVDSTNLESVYQRNKIRNQILPMMEELNQGCMENMARLIGMVKQDSDYLNHEVEKVMARGVTVEDETCWIAHNTLQKLHPAIASRVIKGMYEKLEDGSLEYTHIQQVLDLGKKGQTSLACSLPKGIVAKNIYGKLVFEKAKEKVCAPYHYVVSNLNDRIKVKNTPYYVSFEIIYNNNIKVQRNLMTTVVDYDKIKNSIEIRNRKIGDRYQPLGFCGTKSIKKMMIEQKILAHTRDALPVFVSGNDIIFCMGLPIHDKFKVDYNTKNVLCIRITKE